MSSIVKVETKKGVHYKAIYDLPKYTNGKRRRTSKTFPTGTPIKVVKDFLAEKELEHTRGSALRFDRNITFSELADIYFETYTNFLSPSTLKGYKSLYNNSKKHGLKSYFGNCKVIKITTRDIQNYINFLSSEVSAKTCKNNIQLLNVLFSLAVDEKIIQKQDNPMKGNLVKPKQQKSTLEAFDLEEFNLLLKLAYEDENPIIDLIINLALLSGIRRGEMAGLKWNNINFKEGYIYIDSNRIKVKKTDYIKSPKTDSGIRKIYIPKQLISVLKDWRYEYMANRIKLGKNFVDSGYVVSKENGEPYTPQGISNCYYRFMKRHSDEIRYLKFHGLRHTYASILIEQGENPKTVQHNLGHSDVALTLQIYSHSYESAQIRAAQKLDESIKAIG